MALSPMMQQYIQIKEQYSDCIVLFRLGDFYETFFEDAKVASRDLEITLTGRDCGLEERAPMCGVPFHAIEGYATKLLEKGHKVVIVEQTENPAEAKGLVRREVVRVLTPGTLSEQSMLAQNSNNYITCVYSAGMLHGIAIAEVSTGDFKVTSATYGDTYAKVADELARIKPAELLCSSALKQEGPVARTIVSQNIYTTMLTDQDFEPRQAKARAVEQFGSQATAQMNELEMTAAGALLAYLDETQRCELTHIDRFTSYKIESYMVLDPSSRRNLEISENIRDKNRKATLVWVLDQTVTSPGARMLKGWLEQPMLNVEDINYRLDAVEALKDDLVRRDQIRQLLKVTYDIERLTGKLILGNVNGRDLISIKNTLRVVPDLKGILSHLSGDMLADVRDALDEMPDIFDLVDRAIDDFPPVTTKEGGVIKAGYNSEVDRLRDIRDHGREWLAAEEAKERDRTGIKNLKIGYNRVFGYYIEVTKSFYDLVPADYIRKQTLANAERYITEDLKKIEEDLLGAETKLVDLEYKLFLEVKNALLSRLVALKSTANAMAILDAVCSLAEAAAEGGYVRPVVDKGDIIDIKEGRHPVVEKMLESGSFIPNDTYLDSQDNRAMIITGPNMSGKSTFMRQTAIIVLMAQTGSFVPATSAHIGVADRIFTRVGASDDLAGGQSTFMVEMNEVANIIENATDRSLVILDEIGRGTSTYDGLSIAWAVTEHICDKIGSRMLFATHYHELTDLEGKIDGVKNYSISAQGRGKSIVFLHKIKRGGADGSYGIEVARLAGISDSVTDRAEELLAQLEKANIVHRPKTKKQIEGQFDLLSYSNFPAETEAVLDMLKAVEIDKLSPLEALNVLYQMQQKIKRG